MSDSLHIPHNLDSVISKLELLANKLNRVSAAYDRVFKSASGFNKRANTFSRNIHAQERAFGRATRSANKYAIAIRNANAAGGGGGFRGFSGATAGAAAGAGKGGAMGISGGLWARFAGIAGASIAWQQGTQAVRSAGNLQAMRKAMDFSVGGERRGGIEERRVSAMSERYGVAFQPAMEGLTKLQAAMRGTKMTKRDAVELFEGVTKATVALGLSSEKAHGTFMAVEQIASKGKVSMEELRRQLGDRIPGAFQIAARAMNMTTSELDKLVASGNLMSEDFLPRFADQLSKEFTAPAEKMAQSINAELARLDKTILEIQDGLGVGLAPAIGLLNGKLKDFAEYGRIAKDAWGWLSSFGGLFSDDMSLLWGGGAGENEESRVQALLLNDRRATERTKYWRDKNVFQSRVFGGEKMSPAFLESMEQSKVKLDEELNILNSFTDSHWAKTHGKGWQDEKERQVKELKNTILSYENMLKYGGDGTIKGRGKDEPDEEEEGDMAKVLGGGNRILNVKIHNIIEKNEANFISGDEAQQEGEAKNMTDAITRSLISTLQDLGQLIP